MVVPATSSANPMSQLVESCRAEPVVFDGLRPDLCPALEQVILGRMQIDRGRRVGSINVGGWKSGEDFFAWPEEAVQELRQAIVETVGARSPVAWAMVNRAGSQHPRHQHRVAILSGVYYVTAGSADAIIPTIFECPCDGGPGRFVSAVRPTRRGDRYELEVDPHPGRLVICRGEMWHRVPAYPGDLPRITIAFDVRR
jgi:hypothetical protein